jgi:hypothetical protein
MRFIFILAGVLMVGGCASASPIDFLIPTPTMGVTTNYLGHITPPKMNRFYHSLRDTKNEKAMLPVRKAELDTLYEISRVGNGLVEATYDPVSNGAWALLLLGAGALGLTIPTPGTKSKIEAALKSPPPS